MPYLSGNWITHGEWDNALRRIEKENLKRNGRSTTAVSMGHKCRDLIYEVDEKSMRVASFWREEMKKRCLEATNQETMHRYVTTFEPGKPVRVAAGHYHLVVNKTLYAITRADDKQWYAYRVQDDFKNGECIWVDRILREAIRGLTFVVNSEQVKVEQVTEPPAPPEVIYIEFPIQSLTDLEQRGFVERKGKEISLTHRGRGLFKATTELTPIDYEAIAHKAVDELERILNNLDAGIENTEQLGCDDLNPRRLKALLVEDRRVLDDLKVQLGLLPF